MTDDYTQHVHAYNITTAVQMNHRHRMLGVSSPPRAMTPGEHYHSLNGRTTFDAGHYHTYSVLTGPPANV
ncbi:MAG TPA: hypothetical protein GX507_04675, partial [Clostridia bacterium]|nr:hypothetical protein [Clostridia bacterium]